VEKKCAIEERGDSSRGALRTTMRIRSLPVTAASAVAGPVGRNRSRKDRRSDAS
jgi:hypothetical protein